MNWKSTLIRPFAARVHQKLIRRSQNAIEDQKKTFQQIIKKVANTQFGLDHEFSKINTHQDFIDRVPVRDYESLRPYFDRIAQGEKDVCWPGKPKYLAKTSGTTSGVKYIPISYDSIGSHIEAARDSVLNYAYLEDAYDVFDGKLIFLSGSPTLTQQGGIPTGRLSGISNHEVPGWLKRSQLPSYKTNCIEDWEEKLDKIVKETFKQDLRLISGIPPWVQMFYESILDFTGKRYVCDVFPNYKIFVYGGVNFEPYRNTLEQLVGKPLDSIELFPASEGFFAYQDEFPHTGMLLNTNCGIFYEFIPLSEFNQENPKRLGLEEVELGVDYVMIISSNAGLWAYNLGDTVSFQSLNPYRCIVSGRVKHFISAFGEHVIGKEVEQALIDTLKKYPAAIREFTVAPLVNDPGGALPCHEWYFEFEKLPEHLDQFASELDKKMCEQNIYYQDLIEGKILQGLKIKIVQPGGFRKYMEDQGKLGGQNKVPRLSNDRKLVEQLLLEN